MDTVRFSAKIFHLYYPLCCSTLLITCYLNLREQKSKRSRSDCPNPWIPVGFLCNINAVFARKDFPTRALTVPKGAPFIYYSYYKWPLALKNHSSQGRKRSREIKTKKKVHFISPKNGIKVFYICGKIKEIRSFQHQGNLHLFYRPSPAIGTDCKGKKYYEKRTI